MLERLIIDKLILKDIDKLKSVRINLSKVYNVVNNDIVKKTVCNKLVKKINTTDSDKQNLEKKSEEVDKMIPDTIEFIVTQDFNRLTKMNFTARMAEALKNFATKKQVENAFELGYKNREKIEKLQTFDLSYFVGKTYFDYDGSQNYLIFQPVFKYFQIFCDNVNTIFRWKSKGFSEESITAPTAEDC